MANCVVHSKLPFGQTLVSTGKKYIIGIYLIALSCIMYGGVIIVLFIPFTAQIKFTLAIILAIIGEIAGLAHLF